jgi:hypothetical protein
MPVQQLLNLRLMLRVTRTKFQKSLCIELEIWKILEQQTWVKSDSQSTASPFTTRTMLPAATLACTSCMRWIFAMRIRTARGASTTIMFGLPALQNALVLPSLLESR